MKRLFISLFLLIGITGCPSQQTNNGWVDWNSSPSPPIVIPIEEQKSTYSATVQTLLSLHNKEREMTGRAGLVLDPYLIDYAQNYAEEMARRDRLVHSNISVLMGKYVTAGENIAWNQRTEEEVVNDWMHSSGHKANIMNRNFSKVGFGVARAKNGSLYWCTVFGG